MRLIDADALVQMLENDAKHMEDITGRMWTYAAINDIKNAPTADVVERKKGKWIEDAETYYKAVNEKGGGVNENTPYFTDDIACSECLAKFSVIDNCTEEFYFCPNCGSYNGEESDNG